MLKWLLTLFIALLVLAVAAPWLRRPAGARSAGRAWRLGELPGDLRIPARGRVLYVPFTSTLLLSLLVYLISRIV